MLERCEFCELNEEVLHECGGFSCKDEGITEFFTKEYADYAYQLLGKSYCFVEQEERRIVGAFTVANSSIRADLLPNSRRNKLNRNISLPSARTTKGFMWATSCWMPSSRGS